MGQSKGRYLLLMSAKLLSEIFKTHQSAGTVAKLPIADTGPPMGLPQSPLALHSIYQIQHWASKVLRWINNHTFSFQFRTLPDQLSFLYKFQCIPRLSHQWARQLLLWWRRPTPLRPPWWRGRWRRCARTRSSICRDEMQVLLPVQSLFSIEICWFQKPINTCSVHSFLPPINQQEKTIFYKYYNQHIFPL